MRSWTESPRRAVLRKVCQSIQLAGEEKWCYSCKSGRSCFFRKAAPPVSFDPRAMWGQMGWLARLVVIILFIMSAWSIGVMIDRLIAFNGARTQSRQFAPAVAGALREGKLDEAIKIADRFSKSHLAKVVVAGLQEFRAHQMSSEISGEEIEASKRALERAEAIVHAELKRGIGNLATIGSTAPFVGLFGTVVGIINAFKGISTEKSHRSRRGGGRYFGSPGHHRRRSVRRYPRRLDVQLLHGRMEAFDVEMGNSSSELIDYFLKRTQSWAPRSKQSDAQAS